jgi:hypothetical protein
MKPPTSAAGTQTQRVGSWQKAKPSAAAAGMMASHQPKYPSQKQAEETPQSSKE